MGAPNRIYETDTGRDSLFIILPPLIKVGFLKQGARVVIAALNTVKRQMRTGADSCPSTVFIQGARWPRPDAPELCSTQRQPTGGCLQRTGASAPSSGVTGLARAAGRRSWPRRTGLWFVPGLGACFSPLPDRGHFQLKGSPGVSVSAQSQAVWPYYAGTGS